MGTMMIIGRWFEGDWSEENGHEDQETLLPSGYLT